MLYRKAPKLKHCKIRRKYAYDILEPIRHYKDWLFLDSEMGMMEILPPTLDNLNLMREYSLFFILKGFKNPLEYNVWNKLRINHGFCSMMYASRSVSLNLILDALNSMINDQPLPSRQQVRQSVEENRLTTIGDNNSERKVMEREKYRKLYNKYSLILHRYVVGLIKQGRLEMLE